MGELRVEGSKGVLSLSGDARLTRRKLGDTVTTPINYVWRDTAFGGDCVYALQNAFTEARLAGARFENTAEDYLANLRIEDAIYRSASEGRRIDLA